MSGSVFSGGNNGWKMPGLPSFNFKKSSARVLPQSKSFVSPPNTSPLQNADSVLRAIVVPETQPLGHISQVFKQFDHSKHLL